MGSVLSRSCTRRPPPSSTASRSSGRERPRATSRSRITYSGDGSGTEAGYSDCSRRGRVNSPETKAGSARSFW